MFHSFGWCGTGPEGDDSPGPERATHRRTVTDQEGQNPMPLRSGPGKPADQNPIATTLATLFNPTNRADPYPTYNDFRNRAPIVKIAENLAVVTGQPEATQVLRDESFGHPVPEEVDEGAGHDEDQPVDGQGRVIRAFVYLNPPDHTRLRRLVSKAFTPRMIEQLAPRISELAADLIGRAIDAGEFDLIRALATPLPVAVISELLGVPPADRAQFASWSSAMARASDPSFLLPPDAAEAAARGRREFIAYFRELAAERRRAPGDDLLSALVKVSDAGEILSEGELLVTLTMLLLAGHETTTNLIGNGVLALLRHPEQYAALAGDANLTNNAVEEILRYDSPVQLTTRTAREDTVVGDVALGAGTSALLLIGAANRDPRAHERPDTFDITRAPTRHLAFSQGIHFCLGAPLARLEGQIALRELVRRAPKLALAGAPVWTNTVVLRGLTHLPVTVA